MRRALWCFAVTFSPFWLNSLGCAADGFPDLLNVYSNPIVISRTDGAFYVCDKTAPRCEQYDPFKGSKALPALPGTTAPSLFFTGFGKNGILTCTTQRCLAFDPATAAWIDLGFSLPYVFTLFPFSPLINVIELRDGRVLVAEWQDDATQVPISCIVDPATHSISAPIPMPLRSLNLTMLADGRVLSILPTPLGSSAPVAVSQIFDPTTNSWKPGKPTGQVVLGPEILGLKDGGALVGDSFSLSYDWGPVTVRYSAELDEWKEVPGLLWLSGAAATQFPSGQVLLAGGEIRVTPDGGGRFLYGSNQATTVWDPATGVTLPGRDMQADRIGAALATLADGTVLAMSGFRIPSTAPQPFVGGESLKSVEALSWGQPAVSMPLGPGFFIATATPYSSADDGFWGLQATMPSDFSGPLFFGGILAGHGQEVAFASFHINTPQYVTVQTSLRPLPGSAGVQPQAGVWIHDAAGNVVDNGQAAYGFWRNPLDPGQYTVEIRSTPGSPAVALAGTVTAQIDGGVAAGGSLVFASGVPGYLAFGLSGQQTIDLHLLNEQTYGIPRGAKRAVLTIEDSARNILKTVTAGAAQ